MQSEYIPREYLEKDKKYQMEKGMRQMGEMILEHYPYVQREPRFYGENPVFKSELVVVSAEKYEEAIRSVGRLLAHEPTLMSAVWATLERMNLPDSGENPYKNLFHDPESL